jgi:hypothetical protein
MPTDPSRSVPRRRASSPPPVVATLHRAGIAESRHRGHIVVVGPDGAPTAVAGDPAVAVTLRSAIKPFSLVALVRSGAADALALSDAELAVMAASHHGEDRHVRTLLGLFRRLGLAQGQLRCPAAAPLDGPTAARLARDREEPGPFRHMCSGFHAASLLLAFHAGWSLHDYDDPAHPSQVAVRETVAGLFGTTSAALATGMDDCGLATYAVPLVAVARGFALLADPDGVAGPDAARRDAVPALRRIRDAMLAEPEMVGGTTSIDTQLMKRCAGRLVVKGGAEGLRGIGLLPGARGTASPAGGVAISIEDGDPSGRAGRSVTVETLARLDLLDARDLVALTAWHRPSATGRDGSLAWELIPEVALAPIPERG